MTSACSFTVPCSLVGGHSLSSSDLLVRSYRWMGLVDGRYAHWDDIAGLSVPPAHPRPAPISSHPAPSPVDVIRFGTYLRSHPDQRFVRYVLQGLSEGFRIGAVGSVEFQSSARNHSSSRENPGVVLSYIQSECSAGCLLGPLTPSPVVHVSPIGLVPKSDRPDAWRMIVDLSHPQGHSVNDAIPSTLCSPQYPSIDDAVAVVLSLGRHTQLVKIDLKSAYRVLPVHPADRQLLGVRWGDQVFVDLCLPFGLRSAPKIFTAFADAVAWSLKAAGVPLLFHYLDDFLIFGRPGSDEGLRYRQIALQVLEDLNIPVAWPKLEGPSTLVTFLGILIDTIRLELRLPLPKLARLRSLLSQWCRRRSGSRAGFESLLGHLSQAAIVVRPGRIFLRHLFTLLSRCPRDRRFVHLDRMARADLLWWDCFLVDWHGTSLFSPPVGQGIQLHSDASGNFGCGAVSSGSWFQVRWPGSWSQVHIAAKEMLPIVLAAATWGASWYRKHVTFFSDNMAVVAVIQCRTTGDPILLHLLRCLYFYAAYYQFTYVACHVSGLSNLAADALSRDYMPLFHSLIPQARRVEVSPAVLDLLVFRRPDWGSPDWTALFRASLHSPSPQLHSRPTAQR